MTTETKVWSCLNKGVFSTDICDGEPDLLEVENQPLTWWGKCKLNPEECGRCKPLEECVDLEAEFFKRHEIVETIIPIDGGEIKKPKTTKGKVKKEEDPNAPRQAGMF